MNLNQQQQVQRQMPPNIAFQQPDMPQMAPDHSLLRKLPSTKLDPYKILGISKKYTENELKKAYLKKAMKSHPDRGGSKAEFQKISIAYTVLKKKLKERGDADSQAMNSNKTHLLLWKTQQINKI